MSSTGPLLRPARREDAALIAKLVNRAAEGLPKLLWRDMAEAGEGPWDVGERRAASEDAAISYRHTCIAEMDGQVAGCLITHEIPPRPEPYPGG